MNFNLPTEYVAQKFMELAGMPVHKQYKNVYYGCCPTCREGSSWGKKKRLTYSPKCNVISCFNCGLRQSPIKWISDLTGMRFSEVIDEAKDYDMIPRQNVNNLLKASKNDVTLPSLPHDSINLFDSTQVLFYNSNKVVQSAQTYLDQRLLSSAVNRPKSYWISLTDFVHKNRIIIPYYDVNNKVIHYQSRDITGDPDAIRYISKEGGVRSIFGINQIRDNLPNIFVCEGPFNSTFIKNGVAVGGIQENSDTLFSSYQKEQLKSFKLFDIIWCLDSQWIDNASLLKSTRLVNLGQKVFIWPKNAGIKFKDFNDLAKGLKIKEIPQSYLLSNTYEGLKAKEALQEITSHLRVSNPSMTLKEILSPALHERFS